VRDEIDFGRGRPTAGRVLNTNDCSAVWNGKRASRGAGCVCLPLGSATSAGAEKRFELFTGNSVEPSAGCAPCERPLGRARAREQSLSPAPRVTNSLALRDTHALRPDVSRLSPATADGLLSRRAQKSARSTTHQRLQISHQLSRNHCPRRCKKMCLVYAKCKIESGHDWRRVFCTMPTNPGRTRQGEYNRELSETRVKDARRIKQRVVSPFQLSSAPPLRSPRLCGECLTSALTAETQRAQRGRREFKSNADTTGHPLSLTCAGFWR